MYVKEAPNNGDDHHIANAARNQRLKYLSSQEHTMYGDSGVHTAVTAFRVVACFPVRRVLHAEDNVVLAPHLRDHQVLRFFRRLKTEPTAGEQRTVTVRKTLLTLNTTTATKTQQPTAATTATNQPTKASNKQHQFREEKNIPNTNDKTNKKNANENAPTEQKEKKKNVPLRPRAATRC